MHNGLQIQTTSLPNFLEEAMKTNKTYLANLMIIVRKTCSLANHPPLSEIEIGQRALDWMQSLEKLDPPIPEERFEEVFNLAFQLHEGTFAINAHEMVNAWRQIQEIEKEELAKNKAVTFLECRRCGGKGVL